MRGAHGNSHSEHNNGIVMNAIRNGCRYTTTSGTEILNLRHRHIASGHTPSIHVLAESVHNRNNKVDLCFSLPVRRHFG